MQNSTKISLANIEQDLIKMKEKGKITHAHKNSCKENLQLNDLNITRNESSQAQKKAKERQKEKAREKANNQLRDDEGNFISENPYKKGVSLKQNKKSHDAVDDAGKVFNVSGSMVQKAKERKIEKAKNQRPEGSTKFMSSSNDFEEQKPITIIDKNGDKKPYIKNRVFTEDDSWRELKNSNNITEGKC